MKGQIPSDFQEDERYIPTKAKEEKGMEEIATPKLALITNRSKNVRKTSFLHYLVIPEGLYKMTTC